MFGKSKRFLFVVAILFCLVALFVSCGNDSTTASDQTCNSLIQDFEQSGDALYLAVSNNVESFSFNGKVSVAEGVQWQISTDIQGKDTVPSKTIPLSVGNNTVYLLVVSSDNGEQSLYTVTVRRLPVYTVKIDSKNGKSETLQIEEGQVLDTPETPQNIGYAFDGWDYEFSAPIMSDLTISAKWIPNDDTPYTVEYYLQDTVGDGYTLYESVHLTGATGSIATVEMKSYPHYNFNDSKTSDAFKRDGNRIKPDGSLVRKYYYDLEKYNVHFYSNGGTIESGDSYQEVRYGAPAIIPTISRAGYSFDGWDKNQECESVTNNLTVTAQWSIITYSISYNPAGGDAVNNPSSYVITDDYVLLKPSREGYLCSGWYTDDGTLISNLKGNYSNLNLTARWLCNYVVENGIITGVSHAFKFSEVSTAVIPSEIEGVKITGIGESALASCSMETIVIPNGVASIGNGAFAYCSQLTTVIIPNTVTEIGGGLFGGCYHITDIYYQGQKSQWLAINKNSNWGSDKSIVIHCLDGDAQRWE